MHGEPPHESRVRLSIPQDNLRSTVEKVQPPALAASSSLVAQAHQRMAHLTATPPGRRIARPARRADLRRPRSGRAHAHVAAG